MACDPCKPATCDGLPQGVVLMKKIENMIGDNYTLIFLWFIVTVILGISLFYFLNSIKKTLKDFFNARKEFNTKTQSSSQSSNNPRIATDDNYLYYEDVKEEPTNIDPTEYMPASKRKALEDLKSKFTTYNETKTQYIQNTYSGRKNDDTIDDKVLYAEYDEYRYDGTEDDY
jgi:hypothetical protein